MANFDKTVSNSDARGPSLDLIGVYLNGASALAADEVMVVAGGAGAKQGLAVGRADAVGILVGGEVGERAIDGGQPNRRSVGVQNLVQLLGTDKANRLAKGVTNRVFLPGVAFAAHLATALRRPPTIRQTR